MKGEHMYTADTIRIARSLTMFNGRDKRIAALREALDAISKPTTYSNEDFDRAQALAYLLAQFASEGSDIDYTTYNQHIRDLSI